MLGIPGEKKLLKTKGGETYGLLLFVADAYRKYSDRLGAKGARIVEAADMLCRFMSVCHEAGEVMQPMEIQDRV
eukprot:7334493-Alexandrium_andersonii.AAC.1